jgi:hypothetical protein
MATVRFSKELIKDITTKAKQPFNAKKQEIERSKNFDGWADTVWDAVAGEHKAAVLSLPAGWLKTSRQFQLLVRPVGQASRYIYVHCAHPYPMPYDITGNPHMEMTRSGYLHIKENSTVFAPLIEEVREWVAAMDAVDKQCKIMVDGIEKLTTTYSTLGPALKAWPALWDLLPDYAKDKHKEVVVREKADKKELTADLGAMTAALTVQKMLGKL